MALERINVDLANVYSAKGRKGHLLTLAWGDTVEVVKKAADHVEVKVSAYAQTPDGSFVKKLVTGFIQPPSSSAIAASKVTVPIAQSKVLKVDFVDVQQGDGAVIESPSGQVVLIDGGDNQLFARYLANRWSGTTDKKPKDVDAIVVTHGDADHFLGLVNIHGSESHSNAAKRLFIKPARVLHNGLVKRPGKKGTKTRPEIEMLGATKKVGDELLITGLEDDLTKVADTEMNEPFVAWKKALLEYKKRGKVEIRRLERGDHDAFDFLKSEGIKVEVLGPIPTDKSGAHGLKFLGAPPKGPRVGHESLALDDKGFGSPSASHTINGHSIVLRISFGRFSFLFTGDLNDESGRSLVRSHNSGSIDLDAEVFKVPHHGSADFSGALLKAVSPVVSIVSSGDESARKEYIHPRATLLGALGKHSRIDEPLIFVTELVAFFNMEGFVRPECHKLAPDGSVVLKSGTAVVDPKARKEFFAFSRTAFGIVKLRTDGQRLLVFTHSGQADLKEAYAFVKDTKNNVSPDAINKV